MGQSADYYAKLSDEELAAADMAATREQRIAHLENAFRFAQVACAERSREPNVIDIDRDRRRES